MLHKEDYSRRMIQESEEALFFLNWFITQTKKDLKASTVWEDLLQRWGEKFLDDVIMEYCVAGSVMVDYFHGTKAIYYPEDIFLKLSDNGDYNEVFTGSEKEPLVDITNRVIHIHRPHDRALIQAYSCHVDVDAFSTNEFETALTNSLSLRDNETGRHM